MGHTSTLSNSLQKSGHAIQKRPVTRCSGRSWCRLTSGNSCHSGAPSDQQPVHWSAGPQTLRSCTRRRPQASEPSSISTRPSREYPCPRTMPLSLALAVACLASTASSGASRAYAKSRAFPLCSSRKVLKKSLSCCQEPPTRPKAPLSGRTARTRWWRAGDGPVCRGGSRRCSGNRKDHCDHQQLSRCQCMRPPNWPVSAAKISPGSERRSAS
mmetsp:Transcript_123858/g.361664  ORF Transcript_123858/g.361664 Transcript_123858/m.361664 type:complete len:213 (+) Transcript_123858:217-855(+)